MSTIIVRHTVEDFDVWKSYFDEHATTRMRYGIQDDGIYHGASDPRNVVLIFQVDDYERAQEFFGSDDLRETMQKAGVVSAPTVWAVEESFAVRPTHMAMG
ncbi:MAG: hypothetical protein ABSC51_01635 [Gaiellaceae bacterium]|jgi:hypothetical protein